MASKAKNALEPRKAPRQERAQATLESLVEAAAQVLESVGFEKMTTTKVAERAGTSVGSLYQYFPSKDALLYALVDRKLTRVHAGLQASIDGSRGLPLEARTRLLIETVFRAKAERAKLGAELARQTARLDKRRIAQKFAENNHRLLLELLEEHRSEIPAGDLALTSWLAVHAVTGIADAAMLGPIERLRDPAFVDAVTAHVLGAMGIVPARSDRSNVRRSAPRAKDTERRLG